MCSWTSPSIGKFNSQRGVLPNEEDDEPEDQVVYRHDRPSDLLGLYQPRHQAKNQGSSHGIINKERRTSQETSAKVVLPPSAVEEAAWASLTQADNRWRISSQLLQEQEQNDISYGHLDSTTGHQAAIPALDRPASAGIPAESHGDAPQKSGWAEALEQLIRQEEHSEETRAPPDLQGAQHAPIEDARAEDHWTQTKVTSAPHGARTGGQSSRFQPERKFYNPSSSKGKQKHQLVERVRMNNLKVPQSHVKGSPIPLAQRLQELVNKDSRQSAPSPVAHRLQGLVNEDSRQSAPNPVAQRLQELVHEDTRQCAPIPVALRLQELVDEDCRHNAGPRQAPGSSHTATPLTIVEKLQSLVKDSPSAGSSHSATFLTITEKLQSLVEDSASPRGSYRQHTGTKVSRQLPLRPRRPVSTVQINRTAIQDDIVDCPDADEDDSCAQGSSRYLEKPVQRSRSAWNVQNNHPVFKDEPLEDIDNDDDFSPQETSISKSKSGAQSSAPTSIISELFRDALLSAPLDVTSTDSFGLSARLETLLSAQKSKHAHFMKSLQRKEPANNLAPCLEVVILGTVDEAQLTTCRCEILRSPEEWNHVGGPQNLATNNAQKWSKIDVIFSKISPGVELQVGRVVRIHPPWQEVPRAGQSARLIFCTFFCEGVYGLQAMTGKY